MRKLAGALALALVASPLAAQDGPSWSTIFGPQYVNYKIGTGAGEKTVTQLSVPFALILPFGERFTLDISTSWADSRVSSNGVESSRINGLTDTQIRGNLSLFEGTAVFTLGINAPTGMYKVPDGQQEAAGQIGSDFLLYPVSSMGSGTAATGGVALARTLGEWNLGLGGSFRYSSPFDAYQVGDEALRFEPGSESRFRIGLDRGIGDARVSLGATYSMFTDNKAGPTTFATGARTLGQASLYVPSNFGDWTLSAWDLYRAEGEIIGSTAPWENISNVGLSVGFNMGPVHVLPSVEGRFWLRAPEAGASFSDGEKAGMVGTGGVRFRFDLLGLSVNPAVNYSIGNVYPAGSTTSIDVSGYRATLLMRLR
jgi:hypothetical protein